MMGAMKQFFLTMAGVFAGLLLFFIGVPFVIIGMIAAASKPAPPPSNTLLSLDLRQAIVDQDNSAGFSFFGPKPLSVMTVAQGLRAAAHDGRVKGLMLRLPEGGMAPAAADEIRLAIKSFRASGKPVYAYSQGIYPGGITSATYMVGAAADQLWMQPGASLQSTGLGTEEMFFKRFFDKYGITADYQQRHEYKNAVNPFLYSDFTPAHREATLGWMTSVYTRELAAAAADRKTDPAKLRAALEAGPFDASEALGRKLVDKVGQLSEMQAALKTAAGDDAKIIDFGAYRRSAAPAAAGGLVSRPAIAVIQAEGDIITGSSGSGLGGDGSIHSDDIAKAFQAAIDDKDVKAIVFRVSSPGGSDTASEEILAGVRAAKAAGKPVVVSMGTYAASGGYWISSAASEIVAEPTTLTGSIGVFGGKFVIGPALAKFGVDSKVLTVGGPYAGAFNSAESFTPAQRAAISSWMDRIYDGFVARVAEGRKLAPARVREIAKGRVWTGAQALELGLVDKLGGFDTAVADAKTLAKLDPKAAVTLKLMPEKKSPFESLAQAFGGAEASVRDLGVLAQVLGDPRTKALLREARLSTGKAEDQTVLAPALP
jgi:protease IV